MSFLTLFVFGQDENFNLNDYEMPILKRHFLSTTPSINQFFSTRDEDYNGGLSINLPFSYTRFANLTNKISNSSFNSFLGYGYNGGGSNFQGTLNIRHEDYHFVTDNNVFFQTGFSTDIDVRDEDYRIDFGLPLYIGIGRPQQLNGAWRSATMANNQRSIGNSDGDLSNEQIFETGQFIDQLRNERFFDSRLGRIDRTERMYQHLMDRGFVDEMNITSMANFMDIWRFENFKLRQKVNQFKVGIDPNFSFSSSTDNFILDLPISAFYSYEKAVGLDFQVGFNMGATYRMVSVYDNDFKEIINSYNSISIDPTFFFEYLPNIRNNYRIQLGTTYTSTMVDNINDNTALSIPLSFSWSYYFSPALQFFAGFSVRTDFYLSKVNESLPDSQLYQQIFTGFRYQFF